MLSLSISRVLGEPYAEGGALPQATADLKLQTSCEEQQTVSHVGQQLLQPQLQAGVEVAVEAPGNFMQSRFGQRLRICGPRRHRNQKSRHVSLLLTTSHHLRVHISNMEVLFAPWPTMLKMLTETQEDID